VISAYAVMASGHAVTFGHLVIRRANGHVGRKDRQLTQPHELDTGPSPQNTYLFHLQPVARDPHTRWRMSTPALEARASHEAQSAEVSNRSDEPNHNQKDEKKSVRSQEHGHSAAAVAPSRKKSSGYRGVTAAASSSSGGLAWRARIRFANKVVNLGRCVFMRFHES
jgi:hypothetical protein